MPLDGRDCDALIGTDMDTQRRLWTFQRAGWIGMAVIVLLGLTGFFGNGPISRVTRATPEGDASIDYDRFVRYDSVSRLRLHIPVKAGDPIGIFVSQGYLDRIAITQVTPHPETVDAQPDGVIFHFHPGRPGAAATVIFDFKPNTVGTLTGNIGVPGTALFAVQQFSYP